MGGPGAVSTLPPFQDESFQICAQKSVQERVQCASKIKAFFGAFFDGLCSAVCRADGELTYAAYLPHLFLLLLMQVAREYFLAVHRFGHAAMEHYKTLPGDDCAGECPGGCDCERTMSTTLEMARHAYTLLNEASHGYAKRGLGVPFNWDGAVDLALGEIYEEDGNAPMTLVHWSRYLDLKKENDIMRVVLGRKVTALRAMAIGVAEYEFPVTG